MDDEPSPGAAPPVWSRRAALTCAAGLSTAGLCAAAGCAAGAPSTTAAPTAAGSAATSPSATPPSATSPSAAVGVGSAGTRLGDAADVPVGGGTVYESLEVVVTQPTAGRFQGLSAVCTHTGCIVNKVAGGLIECPCHGSRYRLDGTVARGPAKSSLTTRPVTVVDGAVVLT